MATVTAAAIADLLPTRPPGVTLDHLHSAAREIWPTIHLSTLLLLLAELTTNGLVVEFAPAGVARYHLTEPS